MKPTGSKSGYPCDWRVSEPAGSDTLAPMQSLETRFRPLELTLLGLTAVQPLWSSGCSSGSGPQEGHPIEEEPRLTAILEADLVVLDATPAGLAAAIEASRAGHSALVLSPHAHLGGLTTSGLGATDIGNKEAVGGLAREFYELLGGHYAELDSWRAEEREDFRGRGHAPEDAAAWTFEPHVAEAILEAWIEREGVAVIREAPLDRTRIRLEAGADGVPRIHSLWLEDGREVHGRVFVDASYEGDLLALAEVPHTSGREANGTYGEELNGSQLGHAVHHQFGTRVSAYREPEDPSSGLLAELEGRGPVPDGTGDKGLQAYCYRLCLTDNPELQVAFRKPDGYDAARYELLLRWFDGGADWIPLHHVRMPNLKTDTNNNGPVSSDWIGGNRGWLAADHQGRAKIAAEHRLWCEGLLWTLVENPRVPVAVRNEHNRWGLAQDEFGDNDHWPYRLYVREGRRLVGDLVMTEHHCRGDRVAAEPVGLAAYTMDSHNVHRLVVDGHVLNEGDVQVGGFPPYPIGYRALLPQAGTVGNLVVPVCLSASHIAYGSIRMEPVFFVLGQAAGAAASLAMERDCDLHGVPYTSLRERLLRGRAVLEWTGGQPQQLRGVSLDTLKGQVVDDCEATFDGPWAKSQSSPEFIGEGYRHDGHTSGGRRARFELELTKGLWRIELGQAAHPNRASNALVRVSCGAVQRELRVDQRGTEPGLLWIDLGELQLVEPGRVQVELDNSGADGYVIADAVRALPLN